MSNESELFNFDTWEVSFAKRGVNQRRFLVLKSQDGEEIMIPENLKDVVEVLKGDLPEDVEQRLKDEVKKAGMSEKGTAAVKMALKILSKFKDELPRGLMESLARVGGYAMPKPQTKEAPPPKPKEPKPEDFLTPITKEDGSYDMETVPEKVRPFVEALWKSKDAEAKIQKERDELTAAKVLKEFVEKAGSYENLNTTADDLGPILKEISEKCGEEIFKKVETVLKAADAQVKEAGVTDQSGSDNSSGSAGDVEAQIEAKVKAIAKEDKISNSAAYNKFMSTDEGAELYRKLQEEGRSK